MNKQRTKIISLSLIVLAGLASVLFLLYQKQKADTKLTLTVQGTSTIKEGEMLEVSATLRSNFSDFTVIALPDTQHYSQSYPEIYLAQTEWIVENLEGRNIVFVTHLGDIVQDNDQIPEQWERADKAMRLLDDVVPYGVLPGNHDMQKGGTANYYQQYFPAARYEEKAWWGGNFNGNNKNNYQFFSAGGDDYLILHLQYCPPMDAIQWAKDIIQTHPEKKTIVSTHVFLNPEGERMSKCKTHSDGDVYPIQMWGQIIKNESHVFMVLSGHMPGASRREDLEDRYIYQLLSDYQDMEKGGNGYLRIMTFQPEQDIILVETYSPYLDEYLADEQNEFSLNFDMTGGPQPTGEIIIENGADKCSVTAINASCELLFSQTGEITLEASYRGDKNYRSTQAVPLTITVQP